MIYIDEVIKNDDNVIVKVYWISNQLTVKASKWTTKKDMIEYINGHPGNVKTKYKRNGAWREGEYVHVVDNSYLRTDANNIKQDNLENL